MTLLAGQPEIDSSPAADGLCTIDGVRCYRVAGVDRMPPFLMSVVSDTDLWLFLSSTGGLTAGRTNEDGAIFPYETDDELHQRHGVTGPITLVRVTRADGTSELWEPFAPHASLGERTLYKSLVGNRVVFEESRPDLGLRFRYRWASGERFGYVRTCTLTRTCDGPDAIRIDLLDGLLNLLPAGPDLGTQQRASCLINAYTQAELDGHAGLGLFAMTSLIVDRAEPAEALRANVAWSHGLPDPTLTLAAGPAIAAFRRKETTDPQQLLTGRRGALVAIATITLTGVSASDAAPERSAGVDSVRVPSAPALRSGAASADRQFTDGITWHTAIDAGLDHGRVAALRAALLGPDLVAEIDADVAKSDANLTAVVADSDGIQAGGDELTTGHHFANTLFNVMRGGSFADGHDVPAVDVLAFCRVRNRDVSLTHAAFFKALPARLPVVDLLTAAARERSPDLLRLCYEYLPLTFSRRHGDPSRPWNRFAIRVKDEHGQRVLDYQGNWRDIFQNWEALCLSYPDFIESIVAKFVNASTIDGFNPYRVTRAGVEWECPDPHDSWANIGYWGDHQVAYLLRLLELSRRFHPGKLEKLLDQPVFAYAQVPYRLKPYEELVKDRWGTIQFDTELDRAITARVETQGTDGKLLMHADGAIYHVTLLEKLLVTLLSKLSNFVIGGGIWMNTQRPEWNDANNALVGSGVSVVTLCHVRRYLAFLKDLLGGMKRGEAAISLEVQEWFSDIFETLTTQQSLLARGAISDKERKTLLDGLGNAFSNYRGKVYDAGFTGIGYVTHERLREFLDLALRFVDHTLRASRRPEGLYHAYNLLDFSLDENAVTIAPLYEMLEGQVAALASGALNPIQAIDLIEALFQSKIYRPD